MTVRNGGGEFGPEGAAGHLRAVDGELVCVADGFDPSTSDHATADQKDAAYNQYDRDLNEAWRRAR